MSQHNIIGSEAFDRKPFILLRSYRMAGSRRRRASTTMAYVVVAVIALLIGAVVAGLVLGPQLADAQVRQEQAIPSDAPLSAPAVPGSSATPVVSDPAATEGAAATATPPVA